MNRPQGLDRRQFLQRLAAAGLLTVSGAGVLSACGTGEGGPTTAASGDASAEIGQEMAMADVAVLDSHMAFEDTGGGGVPVVFLHGNPTSSYLWRGVLPHVAGSARCLAPDLIGMGRSGKPEIGYRFADHARYLDAWFDAVGLDEVVLVGHDWGGSLAMDRAARYPERVSGLVVLETFLRPMSWAEYPPSAVGFFRDLRTPGVGERMAIEENWFVERALPLTIADLSAADHAVYRAPYPDAASRRPLLQWPREIPLDGEPADVRDRFLAYGRWLAASVDVPKLLLTVEPGQLVSSSMVAWARANVAALEVESVGPAGHHAPEDRPTEIGAAVAAFVRRHGLVAGAAGAGGAYAVNPKKDHAALVARALDGDRAALDEVVRTVQDPVYRLALRMTGFVADAEDATQEILIRVVTRLSSWRADASLVTWAYRIAVNHLLTQRRRSALERRRLTFDGLAAELVDGLATHDYEGPEATVLVEEVRLRCTQAMLQCLSRSERAVYVLGEVFELSSEEAAWVLDTTAGAYRKRLERARGRIRSFVQGSCGLVNPDAACRCARRVAPSRAKGRLDPRQPMLATHLRVGEEVVVASRQMHDLHDAATVLRSHPDYAAPRDRSEAVLTLLHSGRFPMVDAGGAQPSR